MKRQMGYFLAVSFFEFGRPELNLDILASRNFLNADPWPKRIEPDHCCAADICIAFICCSRAFIG